MTPRMKLKKNSLEAEILKLNPDELLERVNFELSKKELEESLFKFIEEAWHVIEPSVEMSSNWTMEAVCLHLEAIIDGEIRNLIINIPPRFSKSLIANVFFPAWVWSFNPSKQFIFSSYAENLAIRDSIKCRTLVKSNWYQSRWPHVQIRHDQDTKKEFILLSGGHRILSSVGSGGTGKSGDIILTDDPNDAKHARSKNKLEDAAFWWDKVMSTRGNNPKKVAKVIIQQRVSENDLTGHVLKQGGYEHLNIPMEYEEATTKVTSIGWKDPRTEEGELAWPERFGEEEVTELKLRLGSDGVAGQLQQRPSPAGGAIYKRTWFNYYKEAPREYHHKMLSVDCSFKNTEKSDYVSLQVWGIDGARKYLLHRVKKKLDFPETLAEVAAIHQMFPDLRYTLVEDAANGPAVISTFKRKIRGLIPFSPHGDSKEGRAASVAPQVEAGDIWLPDPNYEPNRSKMPWCVEGVMEMVEELVTFPKGANDDDVDSMVQMMIKEETASGWLAELMEEVGPAKTPQQEVNEALAKQMGWDIGDSVSQSEEYEMLKNGVIPEDY